MEETKKIQYCAPEVVDFKWMAGLGKCESNGSGDGTSCFANGATAGTACASNGGNANTACSCGTGADSNTCG